MEFRYRRKVDSTIDMTPLIDTLLQLFVVFLLSMSFMTSAIALDLPQASLTQVAPPTPVIVTIDLTGKTFVNDEPVQKAELRSRLHRLLQESQDRQVLLRADRNLVYNKIMETLVELQQAGATNVHLAYAQGEGKDK